MVIGYNSLWPSWTITDLKSLGKQVTRSLSQLQDLSPGLNSSFPSLPSDLQACVLTHAPDTSCLYETRVEGSCILCLQGRFCLPLWELRCAFQKALKRKASDWKGRVSTVLSLSPGHSSSALPSLVLMSSVPGLIKPSDRILPPSLLLIFLSQVVWGLFYK